MSAFGMTFRSNIRFNFDMMPNFLLRVVCLSGALLATCTHAIAQQVTIINNYGDTTGTSEQGLKLRSSSSHTIVINYYEPAGEDEIDRLEELIGQSLNFYLDQVIDLKEEEIRFRKPRNQVLQDMNDMVKDAVKYYQFKELKAFDGFSERVRMKLEDLEGKEWRRSDFFVRDADPATKKQMIYYFVQKELNDLKLLANTEVGNYSNENLLALAETAIKELDDKADEALIRELQNFQTNDLLQPLELDFSTATVTLLASEDEFILPPKYQAPVKPIAADEFSERILALLEQNNQRMDRIETEMRDIRSEQELQRIARDQSMQLQMEQLRLMMSELLKRPSGEGPTGTWNPPIDTGKTDGTEKGDGTVYNLPDKVNLKFALASAELDLSSKLMLNEIIGFMAYDRSLNILITGYADRLGNAASNLELSKRRASKVRDYLMAQGIPSNRIVMNFFGDADSRYENPDDRKVEVTFMRF